ncbi:unnamed protein product [Linum tenue]|nr:unnamed protein product [Linum tenue]
MVGGTDTTSTMMEWTMAQLVKNPDAMAKVYQELNEVVGQNEIVEESLICPNYITWKLSSRRRFGSIQHCRS